MLRMVILLLVFSGSLYAAEAEIETISATEFAFDIDGSRISVEIRDHGLRGKKDMLLDWVLYSSNTVHHYYGRFPVKSVAIELQVTDGKTVRFGQAFGGNSPSLRIVVGENVTPEMLRKDWILVHEMVHLAMADVPYAHRWLLEGLATYVESIARATRSSERRIRLERFYQSHAAGVAEKRRSWAGSNPDLGTHLLGRRYFLHARRY